VVRTSHKICEAVGVCTNNAGVPSDHERIASTADGLELQTQALRLFVAKRTTEVGLTRTSRGILKKTH